MNLNGYIKLHRKMMAWQWINHPPTLCLFIHLLLSASYKPDRTSNGIMLNSGQVIISLNLLAKETGLSVMQIRTALAHLQATGEITLSTSKGCRTTIATIQNWQRYQDQQSGQQSFDSPQTITGQGFQAEHHFDGNNVDNNVSWQQSFQQSHQQSGQQSFDSPQTITGQGFQAEPFQGQQSDQQRGQQSEQQPIKEEGKKGKKGKKKDIYSDENGWPQFGDFVWMPQKEYDTLVDRFGEPFTTKCIETLGNYKGSSGKKYVSDYRAILNWVVDRVKKDYPLLMKRQPQQQQITTTRNESEWGDGI